VFEIRKPGFQTVRQSVRLVEDVFVSIGLSPAAPTPLDPRAGARTPESAAAGKTRGGPRRRGDGAETAAQPPDKTDKRPDKDAVIDAFEP